MDSQLGIEMETIECDSESPEGKPATSSTSIKNSSAKPVIGSNDDATADATTEADRGGSTETAIGMSTHAAIDEGTDAAIGTNIDAAIDTSTHEAIDRNTDARKDTSTDEASGSYPEAAIDTNSDVAIDISTDAAVNGGTVRNTDAAEYTSTDEASCRNPESTIDTNNDMATDTTTDTAISGSTGAALDTHDSNIGATISESACADIGISSTGPTIDGGSSESAIDAVDTRTEASVSESPDAAIDVITDSAINSTCDVLNANANDAIGERTVKSKDKEASNELKCTLPTDVEMVVPSSDAAQPSISKTMDYQYDSEIEIIDCASESLEDQPAARSAAINNPKPEFTIDGSGDASMDTNTDADVNPSTNHVMDARIKNPKLRKKELYDLRCKNLMQYKMRQKSGNVDQPSKSRSRISHCLDKLTQNNMKFMENFDPKSSNRERRKLLRKTNARRKRKRDLYGLNGTFLSSGQNLCDCMDPHCPGCHFPCPRCHSPKCGHECRVNRKWTYEEIEVDGTEIVIKPHELIQNFCNKK